MSAPRRVYTTPIPPDVHENNIRAAIKAHPTDAMAQHAMQHSLDSDWREKSANKAEPSWISQHVAETLVFAGLVVIAVVFALSWLTWAHK